MDVSMATYEGRKALIASSNCLLVAILCSERKQETGREELAQQKFLACDTAGLLRKALLFNNEHV